MADRKQFVEKYEPTIELIEALAADKDREITEEELAIQRISFAYGNAGENSQITKDSMQQAASRSRLSA